MEALGIDWSLEIEQNLLKVIKESLQTFGYRMNVQFSSTEYLILVSKEIVDMIENIREQNHAPPLSRDQYDTLYETIRLMIVEQVFILRLLFEYLVESTLSNQCEYEEYECSLDQGSL